MTQILLLNGSPRKNGLTSSLLTVFQKKIDAINTTKSDSAKYTVNLIHISDFKLQPCTGCDACLRRPNKCPLSDQDDADKLKDYLLKADAIIIGAPSYFASVPGMIKNLIDRSRPWKMENYLLRNKMFSAIGTAGLQNGFINAVQDVLIHFALIQGMVIFGALGHPVLEGNLPGETLQKDQLKAFRKFDELSEVSIKTTENLAIRLDELLTSIKK